MEWQPIASAPTHEAEFLAWDGFSVFKCYWYGSYGVDVANIESPRPWISHWMPLPPAPNERIG